MIILKYECKNLFMMMILKLLKVVIFEILKITIYFFEILDFLNFNFRKIESFDICFII